MNSRRNASVALSAVAVGIAASACGFSIGVRDYSKKMVVPDVLVNKKVTALDVSTNSSGIQIHAGSGDSVTIKRTVRYNHGTPHPSQQVDNNGLLTFTKGCSDCTVSYDLTVPASIHVKAYADSGGITVQGVKGGIWAHADSGGVRLSDVDGYLDLRTDSGGVRGTGINSTKVKARADSGSIRLAFNVSPANVDASADSGGVTVGVPKNQEGYDLQVHVDSGGKHYDGVHVNSNSPNKLILSADSGGVTVNPI